MLSPRTAWRLLRILADFRRRSETVPGMPIRIWVESTNHCNLRCPMCPNKDMPASDKMHMSLELFRKIVDEARHFVSDMYLHHRGEPLLNPALFDMIACAREAGIHTRFHTNGALLDEQKARRLLDARPNLISFSVDGFDKATYEKTRVGATYEKTIDNVMRLARMHRESGEKLPYVVVEKIRFRNPEPTGSPEQIADLRERLIASGVDEVIEKQEYTWAEDDAPSACNASARAICTFPWYAMVICADGTVTPCPQDFWASMNMGNVKDTSLADIWNGDAYRSLRRSFSTGLDSLTLCRTCDRLHRETLGGIPFQYLVTFLVDQLVGYNRLRKWLGTSERNLRGNDGWT